MLSVFVKFGREVTEIRVERDATTGELRSAVEARLGVLARKQKLLFKGRILPIDAQLIDVGLVDGARVMLISTEGPQTKGQELLRAQREAQRERLAAGRDVQQRQPTEPTTEGWTELPAYVLDVVAAETADLSHNALTTLPTEITRLVNLRSLDCSNNRLSTTGLSSDHNEIERVGSELSRLVQLEKLSVCHNRLAALPESFESLRYLTELNVSHNRLTHLPQSLSSCVALKTLDVQGNQLVGLNEGLSKLTSLCRLQADGNKIRAVPSAILESCASLVKLSLHDNPIVMEQLRETDGFAAYESRRRRQYDKKIETGAMQPGEHFDEGADHEKL